ncbi:MAG: GntR family transcriptional regulator [Thermoflexales bacterium]|nr:GntR family transcriptional regulator [Thermoflexales bacterium]
MRTHTGTVAPIVHPNIRDDVYDHLRRAILGHVYPPGQRLDLDELSTQLGVSRTPIKEALHRLEAEGLVTIAPRRGTFVTDIDVTALMDGYGVRLAFELYAADAIVAAITDADIARLRGILDEMHALLEGPDFGSAFEKYIILDQHFHSGLIALAGNRRMDEIYSTIGGPLHMARILSRFTADDYLRYTEIEHQAILRAAIARDAAALKTEMANHIKLARQRVLARLQTGDSSEAA